MLFRIPKYGRVLFSLRSTDDRKRNRAKTGIDDIEHVCQYVQAEVYTTLNRVCRMTKVTEADDAHRHHLHPCERPIGKAHQI